MEWEYRPVFDVGARGLPAILPLIGPMGGFSGSMDGMVFADHGGRTAAYVKWKREGEPSGAQESWNARWDAGSYFEAIVCYTDTGIP